MKKKKKKIIHMPAVIVPSLSIPIPTPTLTLSLSRQREAAHSPSKDVPLEAAPQTLAASLSGILIYTEQQAKKLCY